MKKQDELRELDAKVAERVMGVDLNPDLYRIEDNNMLTIPAYGSDIKAAWLVVEKMRERSRIEIIDDGMSWVVGLHDLDVLVSAPTAPEAICLAALAAVEAVELIKEYEKGE